MRFISYIVLGALFLAGSYTPVGLLAAADTDVSVPDESVLDSHALHTDEAADIIVEVTPLGEARDVRGRKVKGYKIIHKKAEARTPRTSAARRTNTASCYSVMARGAKWKVNEPWIINPANSSGLIDGDLLASVQTGIAHWEDAADGALGSGPGVNILGEGSTTSTQLVADQAQPDGDNEIYFGQVGSGTIAITIVWGVFGGLASQRQLVEWDQVYGQDYAWSLTGGANKMDFGNIATHELGHTVGLADLYKADCNLQTMYGYAGLGEIIKQSLEIGDIAGIKSLYK